MRSVLTLALAFATFVAANTEMVNIVAQTSLDVHVNVPYKQLWSETYTEIHSQSRNSYVLTGQSSLQTNLNNSYTSYQRYLVVTYEQSARPKSSRVQVRLGSLWTWTVLFGETSLSSH